ncbi:MAG: PAS domain-containing protein [Spirochaetia bacterium]|nr:PAS domain-containing protein [Spirochaetia bacterium]
MKNDDLKKSAVQFADSPGTQDILREEYSALFNHAPCGFITLTPQGSISHINLRGAELIGETQDYRPAPTLIEYVEPEFHGTLVQALQNTAITGEPQSTEFKVINKQEHSTSWVRAEVGAHLEGNGQLTQWQLTLVDITGTLKECRKLEHALEKQKLFMKELNHRVANNLMMISSLILQKQAQEGKDSSLDEIRYQIEAIRYVHEFLQKSEDVHNIDMKTYLHELLLTIFSYFTDCEIEIEDKIEKLNLPSQTAVYIGIIVNEAASNAIKYGFNSQEKPRFTVLFKEMEDRQHYKLELSNTGNPFPEDIDIAQSESLGLSLIASLTEELKGEVELKRTPSPVFTIRFPKAAC